MLEVTLNCCSESTRIILTLGSDLKGAFIFMKEIYDPVEELQKEICLAVNSINDRWVLKQIKKFVINIQKED